MKPERSTPSPRIAPGSAREIGLVNRAVAEVLGVFTGTHAPNVFTTLARHRGLFRRWLVFASGLMPGGSLPRAETELVILRVAHRTGCAYERSHHAGLGMRAGLSREEVDATARPLAAYRWTERQAVLLRATDELLDARRISDPTWAALRAQLDECASIELCMLVGHYDMLAMTLNSLGVQPDGPRGGRSVR